MKPVIEYPDHVQEIFDSYSTKQGSSLASVYAPDEETFWASGDRKATLTSAIGSVLYHAKMLVRRLRPYPNTILYFNEIDSSYTTGQNYIMVSTYAYNEKYSSWVTMEFGFDIILGLTAHEMSHILYTDFPAYRKVMNEKIAALKELEKAEDENYSLEYRKFGLFKNIHNIVEDERIEAHLMEEFPETIPYIYAVRKHYFHMVEELNRASASEQNLTIFDQVFQAFLFRIRYPKGVDKNVVDRFPEFFEKLDSLLLPYPETHFDCLEIIDPLVDLFLEFYEENKEEIQNQEKENSQKSLEAALEKIAKGLGKLLEQNAEENAEGDGDSNSASNEEGDEEGGNDESKQLKEAIGVYSDKFDELLKGVSKNDAAIIRRIIREEDTKPMKSRGILRVSKPIGNLKKYLDYKKEVAQYIPALRKQLDLYSFKKHLTFKSLKSGHLDTGKLAEAVQGIDTIYQRHAVQRISEVCIALVLDQSGSMDGPKMDKTRQTAILLAEAFRNNSQTQLFIYGHTADHDAIGETNLFVYKEPGYSKIEALSSLKAISMNRDGDAILQAAARIRSFTKAPCLMFIVSDGQPNAYRYNKKGILHTKRAVEEIANQGFVPVHIAIEDGIPSEKMFKHSVKFTDLQSLPQQLGSFVKDLFIKSARKIITHG